MYGAFANDPVNKGDAYGEYVETVIDVAGAAYDINEFRKSPSVVGGLSAAVSVAAIFVPVPGPGAVKLGLRAADKAADAAKGGKTAWKAGDDIYDATRRGTPPSDRTVGRRFWKNQADKPGRDDYNPGDLERMKKGKPPQRVRDGETESMERSHEPIARRHGGKDMQPKWPSEHAAVDDCRKLKGSGKKGRR